MRVSGLPDGARLSAGTDLGHGEWVLSQNELGGLTMTLPAGFTGQITLLAEVIDDATHIQAAPSKTMEVKVAPGQMRVEPTAAAATKPRSFAEATAVPDPAPTGETPTEEAPAGSQTSPFSQLQVQAPTRQSTEAETQAAPPVPKPAAETPKAEAAAQPESEKTAPKEEPVVQPEAEKTAPKAEVVTQPEPQAAPPEPEVAAQPAPEAPAPETKVAVLTPPAQTEPAPAAPASSKSPLLTKGDELMNLGDIASARLLYQRALKAGDPRAATALGKSYDPMVFEQLKVHGVLPDANIAIEWYQRGAEGGDVEATSQLQALTTWLKR